MIKFEIAVREAKKILGRIEKDEWRLGKIAANLEPKYGDQTLAKFGVRLGLKKRTIEEYRQVYLAWQDENRGRPRFLKNENRRPRFSVGRELAKHPQKAKLVKKKPDMTHREARSLMRKHRLKLVKKTKPVKEPKRKFSGDVDQAKSGDWHWLEKMILQSSIKIGRMADVIDYLRYNDSRAKAIKELVHETREDLDRLEKWSNGKRANQPNLRLVVK